MDCFPSPELQGGGDEAPVASPVTLLAAHDRRPSFYRQRFQAAEGFLEGGSNGVGVVAAFPEAAQAFSEPDIVDASGFQEGFEILPAEMLELALGKAANVDQETDLVLRQDAGEFIPTAGG